MFLQFLIFAFLYFSFFHLCDLCVLCGKKKLKTSLAIPPQQKGPNIVVS